MTDVTLDTVRELLMGGDAVADSDGGYSAIYVDIEDIRNAAGMHESAYDIKKAVVHWKRLTSGGKAVRYFGYRGVDVVAFCENEELIDPSDDKALSFFVKFTPFGTAVEVIECENVVD